MKKVLVLVAVFASVAAISLNAQDNKKDNKDGVKKEQCEKKECKEEKKEAKDEVKKEDAAKKDAVKDEKKQEEPAKKEEAK